jgi:cytochrome P450
MMGVNYMITRYDDAGDPEGRQNGLSRANQRGIGIVMGRTILEMRAEHVRHRNIISPFFSPRATKGDWPDARPHRARSDRRVAGAGRAELVHHAVHLPMQVMA